MISQLTIFLENDKGRLAGACRVLADYGINLHALNLADTSEFGVARLLCDTPFAAAQALKNAGYQAAVIPVLGIRIKNAPGGLAGLLEYFDTLGVNVEYGYCFSSNSNEAVDVLKVSTFEGVEDGLSGAGFDLVAPEELYQVD